MFGESDMQPEEYQAGVNFSQRKERAIAKLCKQAVDRDAEQDAAHEAVLRERMARS